MELKRPHLIIVRGLPGSGKSFLVNELSQRLGLENVVILDPDATDYDSNDYKEFSQAQAKNNVEEKFHPYRFLRAQAYDGIETNKFIIWNQAFTNQHMLQRTITNLSEFALEKNKALPVLIVEMKIDPEIAKQRVAEREANGGHGVNDERFEQFIAEYDSFTGSDYTVVIIDGDGDVTASADKVIAAGIKAD